MVSEWNARRTFLTILHIRSTDAASIAEALKTYMASNHLDPHKLIGQGYDGAAAFSGRLSGVQKRIRTLAPHALYIHCSCHRLQLASIQTAESVKEVKMMFGAMTNFMEVLLLFAQEGGDFSLCTSCAEVT